MSTDLVVPPPPTGRVATRAAPLPTTTCNYPQLLRGPRWRWWKPLLSLLLLVGIGSLFIIALSLVGEVIGAGGGPLGSIADDYSPISTLVVDLMLATLIPAAGLATWAVHRIRPGFVSSVVGRLRWRWLLRCTLVVFPVWVLYLGVTTLLDPPTPGRPAQWGLLLALAVVVTPFQAAGEEYLFRGWLVQNVSGYFRHPMVGLVVSTVVSAGLFSLAHGSLDPWVIASISTLAVAACYANWRVGGLEAGIALHLVNNVTVGVLTTTIGGYADAFVSEETTGTAMEVVVGVLVHAIAVALILWQARRSPLARTYQPAAAYALSPGDPPDLPGTGSAFDPDGSYRWERDRPIWTAPLG